jgi:hypothetical protein
MATTYGRLKPRSQTTLRVEALLGRYPDLSQHELAELINLFPHLHMVDQGLMIVDDRLAAKLADFHRDHGKKLRASRGELIAALAFPAMLAIIILWSALI